MSNDSSFSFISDVLASNLANQPFDWGNKLSEIQRQLVNEIQGECNVQVDDAIQTLASK